MFVCVLCASHIPSVEFGLGKQMSLHSSTHSKERSNSVPPSLTHPFPGDGSESPQRKDGNQCFISCESVSVLTIMLWLELRKVHNSVMF